MEGQSVQLTSDSTGLIMHEGCGILKNKPGASLPQTEEESPCWEVCIPVIQPETSPYSGEK